MQTQTASDKDLNVTDIQDMPTDSVSCISWTPSGKNPTFATSAWDSFIRIYNVDLETSTLEQKSSFEADSACLGMNWHEDETTLFAGCTDGSVKSFDVETGHSDVIGYHEGLVRSVYWLSQPNALLTLSYDKTLRFWDPRQEGSKHVGGFKLDYKPLCSDLIYPTLAVGLSEAKVMVLNLLNIQSELGAGYRHYLDSPLGSHTQLAHIKLYQGQQSGIGMNDNHGRSNISYFEDNHVPHGPPIKLRTNMTFRAHHKKDHSSTTIEVYPSTSFGFHPRHGADFCYTSGGEAKMYFWDIKRKDKIAEFDFQGTPITKAEIDPTGKFLAYALGYDWTRGISDHMSHASKVCVHVLHEKELEHGFQVDQVYPLKY